MTDVLAAIEERAERIAAHAEANEDLGRLHDDAAAALRETGVMRMMAPKAFGGSEAHPVEFAEAVMRIAAIDGSTGWVAGIVGVHPWELAMASQQVQEEVWGKDGENADVWVASPYAPMGVLRPVDGGYVFNGRWQFSSGTDHCQWVFLGALMGDGEGKMAMPPTIKHVLLPRSDYTIVEDSWDVIGLKGTGSKDLIVKDAFIPEHRVVDYNAVVSGQAARDAGLESPTFHVPFTTVFPPLSLHVPDFSQTTLRFFTLHTDGVRERTFLNLRNFLGSGLIKGLGFGGAAPTVTGTVARTLSLERPTSSVAHIAVIAAVPEVGVSTTTGSSMSTAKPGTSGSNLLTTN